MTTQARIRKPIRVNLEARAAAAEARRARTRERLLDAAEAVVAKGGVEAVSIATIVESAGVSRGVFYNYFPTALDLLNALNLRVAADLTENLKALARRPVGPVVRLAASLHVILAAYLTDPVRGWVALQVSTSHAPRQRALEAMFEALYTEGVREGYFRKVDLAAALTVCFGAIRMAQRDVMTGSPPATSVTVVALVLAAFGVDFEEAQRISAEEAARARAG